MKMDPDLMRKILKAYETLPEERVWEEISILGCKQSGIRYHEKLLADRKFIEIESEGNVADDHTTIIPIRLTFAGHEFLEQARNDTNWNKAKSIIVEKGLPMTIDVLSSILGKIIAQALGLP